MDKLEEIDKKISYYDKLFSFARTTKELNVEDIIDYTNLREERKKIIDELYPRFKAPSMLYSENRFIGYLEYFTDIFIGLIWGDS
jgi:hypothetical protein